MTSASVHAFNFNLNTDFVLYDDCTMSQSPVQPLTRNYVISRRAGIDADEDPTALEFFPAKESDELYEALKEAFPAYRTHKERMREAVLLFFLEERQQDEMARIMSNVNLQRRPSSLKPATDELQTSATASFASMPESTMPSPAYFLQPQHSHGSLQSSPDYLPSPESQFTNTFPSTPAMTASDSSEQISAVPNSMAVPGLREMTTVWSVSSSSQPKVRTRRAMTEVEKKEYRRKRIDGACADCRRRRRKCDHESSESDSSSKVIKKSRKASRVTAGSTARQKAPVTTHFLGQSSTEQSPNLSNTLSPQSTEFDLPSSMLWPEDSSFDFSGLDMDAEFLNPPIDPLFDFVDFTQADGHDQQQASGSNDTQDVWASTAPTARPQQHVPSSGMIMPLPSYYARMEESQDRTSSGGTVSSAASPTNIPLSLTQQRRGDLSRDSSVEESIQRSGLDQRQESRESRGSAGARTDIERSRLPPDDGRPIPPRDGAPAGGVDGGAINAIANTRAPNARANDRTVPGTATANDVTLARDRFRSYDEALQRSATLYSKAHALDSLRVAEIRPVPDGKALDSQLQTNSENLAQSLNNVGCTPLMQQISGVGMRRMRRPGSTSFATQAHREAANPLKTGVTAARAPKQHLNNTVCPPVVQQLSRSGMRTMRALEHLASTVHPESALGPAVAATTVKNGAMAFIGLAIFAHIVAQHASFLASGFTAVSLLITLMRVTPLYPSGSDNALKGIGGQLGWRTATELRTHVQPLTTFV